MSRFFGLAFITCLALTGCSSLQKLWPEPQMMDQEDFSARNLRSPELKQFFQQSHMNMPDSWDFRHLYMAAIYYSPDLAEAKAQFHAVNAAEITAGQSPNPSLNVIPTFDSSTTPSAWLLGLGLNIPIETNGKRNWRLAVAKQQSFSTQAQIAGKAWDVRNRVLNALIDLAAAKETIGEIQALANIQSKISDVYARRTAQGQLLTVLGSQNEVSYQQTLLQLEQSKADFVLAEIRLAGAIGVPASAIHEISIVNRYPPLSTKLPGRKKSLIENPLLLSALSDYHAAHNTLQLELAKQVPDISIGPGYEWNNQQGGKISLGLSLTLPIMNNNEGPVTEAAAKRVLAARHFDTVQVNLINTIEQAETNYNSTNRQMMKAQEILGMQQEKQSRLLSQLKQKNTGNLPILYAQNETQTLKIANVVLKAKNMKAAALLEDALRQPLFGPMASSEQISGK